MNFNDSINNLTKLNKQITELEHEKFNLVESIIDNFSVNYPNLEFSAIEFGTNTITFTIDLDQDYGYLTEYNFIEIAGCQFQVICVIFDKTLRIEVDLIGLETYVSWPNSKGTYLGVVLDWFGTNKQFNQERVDSYKVQYYKTALEFIQNKLKELEYGTLCD